jgi:hypothetical protein
MEAALVRKAQTAPGIATGDRRPLDYGDPGNPDLLGSFELPVEQRGIATGAEKQITVHAAEVAVDLLVARNLPICPHAAPGCGSRAAITLGSSSTASSCFSLARRTRPSKFAPSAIDSISCVISPST